jgi:para-nitrobenzyl esterase
MHCNSHLRSARAAGLGSRARRTLCAFVTVALAAMCIPQSGFSKQPTVTVPTTSGLVRGQFSDDGSIEIFRGIPYAAPPVGSLRWAAPQPPAPWSGVLDAFQARTPCPQTGQYASLDEDCLYLNVFVPFRYANNKLPVMVWIHPGGQTSSAANDWYPASQLTETCRRSCLVRGKNKTF